MTFAKRKIDLTFQLGKGAFGEDGSDTVKVSGLRCTASITMGTGHISGQCDLRIWGLSLDIMNRLTILKQDYTYQMSKAANYVLVEAGDENGMSTVFFGGISEAIADFSGTPDTVFQMCAFAGLPGSLKPVAPISYKGPIDAALIFQNIAQSMGRTLENSGVSVSLPDTYLPGDVNAQFQAVKAAAHCQAIIDPLNPVIAIWPLNGVRNGVSVVVSKDTGLVGYPAYVQNGVSMTTLYNPNLYLGGTIKLETLLTPAAGHWMPYLLSHELSAEVPGGPWYTHIECGPLGSDAPIVTG